MPGIVVTLTGSSAGYERMLQESVAQAKMAGREIQLSLKSKISVLEQAAIGAAPGSKNAMVLQERLKAARLELAKTEAVQLLAIKRASGVQLSLAESSMLKEAGLEYRRLATVAAEAEMMKVAANRRAMEAIIQQEHEEATAEAAIQAERVAAEKAAQWARIELVAQGEAYRAAAVASHGGGGISGIIRESLVIIREVSMGRGLGRIGGSITLLAQYFGVLGKAVKSSAAEALFAEKAEIALAESMAAEAFAAKGTAAAEELAAASAAQDAKATMAVVRAKIALRTATVALNPIFWAITAAIVVTAGAAFLLYRHYAYLRETAKNLADTLNPLKRQYTELAAEKRKNAEETQKNADWLEHLMDSHKSEEEIIDRKIKLLREEAKARRETAEAIGASQTVLEKLDKAQLEAEKKLLETEETRLKTELDKAKADEQTASANAIAGATITDESGRQLSLSNVQDQEKRIGSVLEAAQTAMENMTVTSGGEITEGSSLTGFTRSPVVTREANENDMLDFKSDGEKFHTTFAELKSNYDTVIWQLKTLATDQAALDDTLKNAKSTATDKANALKKVQTDEQDINDQLGKKPGGKKGHHERMEVTERERIGLGAASNIQASLLASNMRQEVYMQQMNIKLGVMQQHLAENGGAFE